MAAPTAPNTMSDFMSQAKNFVEKAKAAGKSNTAIANTLTLMYNLTQKNIENTKQEMMTPYQQAQLDLDRERLDIAKQGNWELTDTGQMFNPQTGVTKNNEMIQEAGTVTGSDFGFSPQPATNQVQEKPTAFDFESLYNSSEPSAQQAAPSLKINVPAYSTSQTLSLGGNAPISAKDMGMRSEFVPQAPAPQKPQQYAPLQIGGKNAGFTSLYQRPNNGGF